MQKFGPREDQSGETAVKDGFIKGESSPLDQANALKRLATSNVGKVDGQGTVEEFGDLTLNGLNSTKLVYLGI